MQSLSFRLVVLSLVVVVLYRAAVNGESPRHEPPAKAAKAASDHWSSFIASKALCDRLGHPNHLVIDVRSPAEYVSGHILDATNLQEWGNRDDTPVAKPEAPSPSYARAK